MEIKLILKPQKDQFGDEYFIVGEVDKDIELNLKDWIIFVFPPAEDEKYGTISIKPRKKKD